MTKLRQLLPILFIAAALYACSGSGGIGGGLGSQGAAGGDSNDHGVGSGQPSMDGLAGGDTDGCPNCGPGEDPGDTFTAEPPPPDPDPEPNPQQQLGVAPYNDPDGDDGAKFQAYIQEESEEETEENTDLDDLINNF